MMKELSLRIAAPVIYQRMIQTFEKYHIHPYDTQGTAIPKEDGLHIILRFAPDFSRKAETTFSMKQASQPDQEVTHFFEKTAEQCKSELITNYFKMIKP
ncbi:hypothetical protein J2Z37_003578 [Ammoniphilus resinae]|uniref:DUF2218 domain-containing protein n=2 Tax=Ammoniphilus resinae TaxID=861532 RepID=A0ABS4GUM2_9BACL|nr:hypothetical protein [Ammoniphilus resinae]